MDRKIIGYTLIELLFVIAITSILGALIINEIIAYIQEARLREAVNQFTSELNHVKNQAVISLKPFGIRACKDSNRYKIFLDLESDCKDVNPQCVPLNQKVCANKPDIDCTHDENICGAIYGPCIYVERVVTLPTEIAFKGGNDFFILFNRMGYAFGYNCTVGFDSVKIENSLGKSYTISVSRYGRIKVEQ